MSDRREIDVTDVVALMKDYMDRRFTAHEYRQQYFALFKERLNVPNEQVDRVLQKAYSDADDFDEDVKLSYTIDEPTLRLKVADSLRDLALLGFY